MSNRLNPTVTGKVCLEALIAKGIDKNDCRYPFGDCFGESGENAIEFALCENVYDLHDELAGDDLMKVAQNTSDNFGGKVVFANKTLFPADYQPAANENAAKKFGYSWEDYKAMCKNGNNIACRIVNNPAGLRGK